MEGLRDPAVYFNIPFTGQNTRMYCGRLLNVVYTLVLLTIFLMLGQGRLAHKAFEEPKYYVELIGSSVSLTVIGVFILIVSIAIFALCIAFVLIEPGVQVMMIPYCLSIAGFQFIMSAILLSVSEYERMGMNNVLLIVDSNIVFDCFKLILLFGRTNFLSDMNYVQWKHDQILLRTLFAAVAIPLGYFVMDPLWGAMTFATAFAGLEILLSGVFLILFANTFLSVGQAPNDVFGAKQIIHLV